MTERRSWILILLAILAWVVVAVSAVAALLPVILK
jgi:hypothetical protein